MAPHSSTLAWKIPWMEEPGGLQSMRSWRVGHDWATSLSLSTFMHWRRKWQPTPVFLPGESHGRRSLVGWVHGVAQSLTRLKWLSSISPGYGVCYLVERPGVKQTKVWLLILLIFWQYNLEMSFSLSQTHVQDILSETASVRIYSPIQNMSVLRDWRYVHNQWICPCIHTSVLNRGWINLLNKIPEHWNIYILEKQRLSGGIELMQYFRTEGMFIRVQLVFYLAIVEKERVSLILGVL